MTDDARHREARALLDALREKGLRPRMDWNPIDPVLAALRKRDEEIDMLRDALRRARLDLGARCAEMIADAADTCCGWNGHDGMHDAKCPEAARSDERSKIAERLRERAAECDQVAGRLFDSSYIEMHEHAAYVLREMASSLTSPEETGQ